MIAILSDIHSNLQALKTTLDLLAWQNITNIWCTGDLVEYPEEANEVIDLIRRNKVQCVLGNNDKAYCQRSLNPYGESPSEPISDDNLEYLDQLPLFLSTEIFYLVHGFPPDSCTKYIDDRTRQALLHAFTTFHQQLAFVGHTHQFKIYELTPKGEIRTHDLIDNEFILHPESRYMVNCGSVGQIRGTNKTAGYLLYDRENQRIRLQTI